MSTFKVPFAKGRVALVIMPPATPPQADLTLTYTPE
jgi:hypothetical protein